MFVFEYFRFYFHSINISEEYPDCRQYNKRYYTSSDLPDYQIIQSERANMKPTIQTRKRGDSANPFILITGIGLENSFDKFHCFCMIKRLPIFYIKLCHSTRLTQNLRNCCYRIRGRRACCCAVAEIFRCNYRCHNHCFYLSNCNGYVNRLRCCAG